MKNKIAPCLWFNGDAEDAAELYVSLVPDSAKAKRAMESMMTMMKIDIAELEKAANSEKA